jgi:hypothetical protein
LLNRQEDHLSQSNQTATLPAVGPFQTFRDYLSGVQSRVVRTPKRATRRHRPMAKGSVPGRRRVVLAKLDAWDAWSSRN